MQEKKQVMSCSTMKQIDTHFQKEENYLSLRTLSKLLIMRHHLNLNHNSPAQLVLLDPTQDIRINLLFHVITRNENCTYSFSLIR